MTRTRRPQGHPARRYRPSPVANQAVRPRVPVVAEVVLLDGPPCPECGAPLLRVHSLNPARDGQLLGCETMHEDEGPWDVAPDV